MAQEAIFDFAAVQKAANASQEEATAMDVMSIAETLVKEGKAGLFDLNVVGATATLHPHNLLCAQVTLHTKELVPCNVPVLNGDGSVKKSVDNHTFYTIAKGSRLTVSSYNIAAALRQIAPELAGAIAANPLQAAPLLLAGAQVRACCIAVQEGTNFTNPFSKSEKGFVPPTNRVVWSIISVTSLAESVNRRREQAIDNLFNSLLFQRQQRVAPAAPTAPASPESAAF